MDEIKTMMGSLPEPDEIKLPPMVHSNIMSDLPTAFDSRTAWPNCESIKEIRDQSNCGSCWAFGAAEAISDRICIHSNQTKQVRISAQDLVSCCPSITCGNGCRGGYPSGAWSWFKRTGVVTGYLYSDNKWCYPYAMAPCDHHTTGQYEPCTGEKATPKCD
jgi:cathepsin B